MFFLGHTDLAQLFHDGREKARGHRQIEKPVPSSVVLLIDLGDLLRKPLVCFGILEVAPDVINALRKPGPSRGIEPGGGVLWNFVAESFSKTFCRVIVAGEADDGELFGKESIGRQVAQRRNELAFGEISGGAEYNHHTRRGDRIFMDMAHEKLSLPRSGNSSVC